MEPMVEQRAGATFIKPTARLNQGRTLSAAHWQEYLMECAELSLFMVSACAFTVLLQHPTSPVRSAIPDPTLRRVLTGLAMGLTAIALIYSSWGKQSGAHFNPAVTLTFFRLKKVAAPDALFYMAAQFAGGVLGVLAASLALGSTIRHEAVRYAATVPGMRGSTVAFLAEVVISFVLMTVVLNVSNSSLARYTGICAAVLVATYISFEAPLSGMSMNPARSLASALPAQLWKSLWIYFTAPPLGMLAAAELYVRTRGASSVICAKLHHQNDKRCIFRCGYKTHSAVNSH